MGREDGETATAAFFRCAEYFKAAQSHSRPLAGSNVWIPPLGTRNHRDLACNNSLSFPLLLEKGSDLEIQHFKSTSASSLSMCKRRFKTRPVKVCSAQPDE